MRNIIIIPGRIIMYSRNTDTYGESKYYLIKKYRFRRLRAFFMGPLYPLWIAFSVLVGRTTGYEIAFAIFDLLLVAVAFAVCDSVRPIIPIMLTFLYRIPLIHAPGAPTNSTYYSGTKLVLVFAAFGIAFTSLLLFYVRKRRFRLSELIRLPLLLPLILLSAAFLLNGTFYEGKSMSDVGYSLLQVLVFAVVFWLLYLGLKDEDPEELSRYFTYVCATIAIVLIVEVAQIYLYTPILAGGYINEEYIYFGWGISNTGANCLSVLIPILFLGVIKSRWHILYFALATLTLFATYLTLSRNGVLFGTLFYVICLLIVCFRGKKQGFYRGIVAIGTALIAGVLVIYGKMLYAYFYNMIAAGFSDSGRFMLWRYAFEDYLKYPIFGKGFFSFTEYSVPMAGFIPYLAHNTVFELLMAMGTFGFVAYLIYRVCTLVPFVKNPRPEKTMLLLSVLVLICESLIDNYIFWFAPTFVYNVAIVIAILFYKNEKTL